MGILRETLREKVATGLAACIGCRECLRVCPVAPPSLRIADLNQATSAGDPPQGEIARFAAECTQCGLCVPVCPTGLERDAMVLWLRSRMDPRPREYFRLETFGPGKSVGRKVGVAVHNLKNRGRLGQLAQHADKRSLQPADTLFFFGCTIFSETGMAAKVLDIADYLKTGYEVLGGLTSCCGWGHYMAGDLTRAEEMMAHVAGRIGKVAPREVVVSGSECYAALSRIAAVYDTPFTPVTVSSWIRRNLHRFPLRHFAGTMTFHDACHTSRKLGEGEEPRRVLRQLGAMVEMPLSGAAAPCCGHHQFGVNPEQLLKLRRDRLDMAADAGAQRMVVECVHCQEAFSPVAVKGEVEVVSLVDLIHDLIIADSGPTPQPVHFSAPVPSNDGSRVPAEGA
ncbi:MAG: (Fe-S)-binding protein [Nitrospirota bacterium]|nr:(Fe-S)-binding protein [Nitrospirota bacterium]